MFLAFHIAFQVKMLAIIDGVCELRNPIAEDKHTRLTSQSKVEFNMTMAEDEEIDIWMLA